jgi:sulfate permease, SulP family
MAGCAMIGQSMINVRSGARTRLSTLSAGVFLLVLILGLGDLAAMIPMAALVAVMIVVAVATFDWSSLKLNTLRRTPQDRDAGHGRHRRGGRVDPQPRLRRHRRRPLAMLVFARRAAHRATIRSVLDPTGTVRSYVITGELFFVSANELVHEFDLSDPTPTVVIDLTEADLWDSSAVAILDAVVARYAARGVDARITGLTTHSADLHDRLTGQLVDAH